MDDEPPLLSHRDDRGVLTLTLNRPQALNALSESMLCALREAFGALAGDEDVRAVVLAAAGKAFCAGHDLKGMGRRDGESADRGPHRGRICRRRGDQAVAGASDEDNTRSSVRPGCCG